MKKYIILALINLSISVFSQVPASGYKLIVITNTTTPAQLVEQFATNKPNAVVATNLINAIFPTNIVSTNTPADLYVQYSPVTTNLYEIITNLSQIATQTKIPTNASIYAANNYYKLDNTNISIIIGNYDNINGVVQYPVNANYAPDYITDATTGSTYICTKNISTTTPLQLVFGDELVSGQRNDYLVTITTNLVWAPHTRSVNMNYWMHYYIEYDPINNVISTGKTPTGASGTLLSYFYKGDLAKPSGTTGLNWYPYDTQRKNEYFDGSIWVKANRVYVYTYGYPPEGVTTYTYGINNKAYVYATLSGAQTIASSASFSILNFNTIQYAENFSQSAYGFRYIGGKMKKIKILVQVYWSAGTDAMPTSVSLYKNTGAALDDNYIVSQMVYKMGGASTATILLSYTDTCNHGDLYTPAVNQASGSNKDVGSEIWGSYIQIFEVE